MRRWSEVEPDLNRAMLASLVMIFRLSRKPVRILLGDRRRRLILREPFADAIGILDRLGMGDTRLPVRMGKWILVIPPSDEMRLVLCSHNRFTRRFLGEYEAVITRILQNAVRPGSVVMDVGAHVGRYVVLMAEAAGKDGRVIAMEPEPGNLGSLRACVSLNGLSNVTILPCACSDRDGEAVLNQRGSSFLHSITDWELESMAPGLRPRASIKERITVPTRSLDSVLDELGLGQVDLVKIDVEGAERLVLKGAEKSLRTGRIRSLIIEVHAWEAKPEEIASMLGEGYLVQTPTPGHLYARAEKDMEGTGNKEPGLAR